MCVLSIKVPIRKKSGNVSYAPRTDLPVYNIEFKGLTGALKKISGILELSF